MGRCTGHRTDYQPIFALRVKAHFHTFGCKLNFAETATIADHLARAGISAAAPGENPDFVIVNTCSVTEEADRKCRRAIRSFNRRWPQAAIVVTGCYAQLKPEQAASMPGVRLVVGADAKMNTASLILDIAADPFGPVVVDAGSHTDIREFRPSCSRGDRTRFFLKVQDGCDYYCSYCTIPLARGRSRSGSIDSLVALAREAADLGGKEIIITGVNVGDFGRGTAHSFFDLIRALDQVDGISRFRISSIEPNLLTDQIIEWVARDSRAFMPHFHIPLQAGSDQVLRLMRRRYDTALFRHKIETVRSAIPHAFIGVDLITGARGETPELFDISRDFVESLPISRLHVFPYSERPSTRALLIDHVVDPAERARRTEIMLKISDAKFAEFASRFVGTVRPVLLEHPRADGRPMAGFTDNYLRVEIPDASPELDNTIVSARLTSTSSATISSIS